MLLQDKIVVVFAASGAIASEVARRCIEEGAQVYLSARRAEAARELADELGERAFPAQVDALDERAVRDYLAGVVTEAGSLDVVFNGIGDRPQALGYPAPALEQEIEAFLRPLQRIVVSQFLTAREAAGHMAERGKGAIVTLSATLSAMAAPNMAGLSAACGGIEAMTRSLAGEFSPAGIRVNCVRGSAMPETRTIQETGAAQAALGATVTGPPPLLGRPITVAETAATVAFLGSEHASGITGQVVTVCAGSFV